MWIYVVNIALILYWWFLYEVTKNISLNKSIQIIDGVSKRKGHIGKIFLFLPFLQIYLLLSLKNISVGTDTISYLNGFWLILNTTWSEIFNFNILNLVFNFERGFILFSKCITVFTKDFTVYTSIIYVFMVIPLYNFIKKHSSMPFLSLILFITLGFLNFYLSGMRQAIAFSLVLLSYDLIIKRKMWRFFGIIAIAMLFHKSAIFFAPAYFFVNIAFTPIVGMFYWVALVIGYFSRYQILEFVTRYIYSGVEIIDTGAYTLLFIVLLTFIAGMLTYRYNVKAHENNKLLYNLIATAVALMIFNTVSNIGLRAANYYYIFMIIFIPNILIPSFREKSVKLLVSIAVIALTLTYYFFIGVHSLNGTPYSFFWD